MSDETRTVLILDDDDAVRENLVDFFEDCGWRVLSAANAEDAIELAASELPDGAVVVATGTSCRHQIADLTRAEPVHMAELLADHLVESRKS